MTDFCLNADELAFYLEHGYLTRSCVFSAKEISRLIGSVEAAARSAYEQTSQGKMYLLDGKRFVDVGSMTVQFEHGLGSDSVRVIEPAQHLHPDLASLIRDERIIAPIRSIVGGEIGLWTNKLNLKVGVEGSGFGWHQDSPYWIHYSNHVDQMPNVYLAFDDATEANGCLRVIDRSHHSGCLPGAADGTQLGGFFTDPQFFDEQDAVSLTLAAGSMVFFDPHVVHGSNPNRTTEARRAMVMTYQPAGFPMLKTGEVVNIDV